jgi:hypothetical protein
MGVAAERLRQASPAREDLKGTTYELFILAAGSRIAQGPPGRSRASPLSEPANRFAPAHE